MSKTPDPFHSPKRRLARAKEHIARFKKRLDKFIAKKPYRSFVELDTDGTTELFGFKLIKPIPDSCTDAAVEAIEALRSALDQAGYATAVLAGKIEPKHAKFPISATVDGFEPTVKGWCKDLPDEIRTLFRSFKCYPGGNDLMWAMNKLRHGTHTKLTPLGTVIGGFTTMNAQMSGNVAIMNPVWDGDKNQIILARVGKGSTLKSDISLSVSVAFGEIELIKDIPAYGVLRSAMLEVERILKATESESRHIGLIP